jgi:dipeptidase E
LVTVSAIRLIPFNINAHYLDLIHKSNIWERQERPELKEFHSFNTIPVLGLRGSWLDVKETKLC